MAKLIVFDMMTLDGFFAGPGDDIDWHNVDSEFNDFAAEQLDTADTLIFGRVTYDLMAHYWPTEEALMDDPVVAEQMNTIPKVVFSRTMEKADWQNTRVFNGNVEQVIGDSKRKSGKNLLVLGSANLAASLRQFKLIDEYRVMVNPVILGEGVPLFKHTRDRQPLKLVRTEVFDSGNVLLCYEPKRP